ncbi:MAG: hypothetical protein ABEJ98_05710 [Candidatus Nanohaloarchaea archaeon]
MTFLLDSLRERFGSEEQKGFPDMNYVVGNTSGMDVGPVPSQLDRRIGHMSKLGGELMEVQITNPATFQIDRPELINTVNQLGLDMTLHGDPNIGFASSNATGGQVAGFNTVHRYFKRYLEQFASFKEEVEAKKQRNEIDFDVGYVNMHASNEPVPRINQQRARDQSVGPFGHPLDEVGDKEKDIYSNTEFLDLLFDFFIENQRQLQQVCSEVLSNGSELFRERWKEVRADTATERLKVELNEIEDSYRRLDELISIIEGVAQMDSGVNTAYLEKLDGGDYRLEDDIEVEVENRQGDTEEVTIEGLQDLRGLERGNYLRNIRNLSDDLYKLKHGKLNVPPELQQELDQNFDEIAETLASLLMDLWRQDASVSAKLASLERNLSIQQSEIVQSSLTDIEEDARKAFRGEEEYFEGEGSLTHPETIRSILGKRVHAEASVFFRVMPAWMMTSDHENDNHPGWDAPRFIWDRIVGEDFESYSELRSFAEDERENELNIIAAVAACYVWGHFTQNRDSFDTEVFKQTTQEVEEKKYTWVEWMNKFGIKVNLEAMFGDPHKLKRLWRPKDIAITCRAINMTARKQSQGWSEDYTGPLVKFTIDMEHTASYGVDPLRELKKLIEQEEEIADEVEDASTDKPLADIVKTYHLTKPGFESKGQRHRHGSFAKGDTTLYKWLYHLVENGFARNEDDPAIVMFEVGGEYEEDIYTIKVALNMIEIGIKPEEVDASKVDPGEEYSSKEEALLARFFGMDRPNFDREWSKIEEHAFDPLKGLLEAQDFDYTQSSNAAVNKGNQPGTWKDEEYR